MKKELAQKKSNMDKWLDIHVPLAHSYIVYEADDGLTEHLLKLFPNAEIIIENYSSLGVNEAKSLLTRSFTIATAESPQIFIILFEKITEQAQNTLLKVMEEPTLHTHFFLCIPREVTILPTLVSRCLVLKPRHREEIKASVFLDSNFEERLKIIDPLIQKGNIEDIAIFLNQLEVELHKKTKSAKITEKDIRFFMSLRRTREFLRLPSASIKQMLQHLASTA